jgi:general stress protein YciG
MAHDQDEAPHRGASERNSDHAHASARPVGASAHETARPTGKQGFASMDVEKQRSIASKGGSSVPADKRPFARDHGLAAAAGRKGGEASHTARRARKEES